VTRLPGVVMNSLRTTLVIGVGNRFRGDDGIGLVVAERLCADCPPGAEIALSSGEAAELMDLWEGRDSVIIVDAAKSNALAGTIHTVEVDRDELPLDVFQASTHTFGLAQAIELARALNRLPRCMIVYGIEGVDFDHGKTLSPPVAAVVEFVAAKIRCHLQTPSTGEHRDT